MLYSLKNFKDLHMFFKELACFILFSYQCSFCLLLFTLVRDSFCILSCVLNFVNNFFNFFQLIFALSKKALKTCFLSFVVVVRDSFVRLSHCFYFVNMFFCFLYKYFFKGITLSSLLQFANQNIFIWIGFCQSASYRP